MSETRDQSAPSHTIEDDDGIIYVWDQVGYGLKLDHLRESSDGLHAEITVKTSHAWLNGGKEHIHWARLNLSSTQTRSSLVKHLASRPNQADVDWATMIEYSCTQCARWFRRGEPFVDLSKVVYTREVPFLLRQFLPLGEISVLYAPAGTSKSIIALMCGVAVRLGNPVGNLFIPTMQSPVLYLDWETREETHARRMAMISNGLGYGLATLPVITYRRQYRTIADDAAQIKAKVRDDGIKFVIVDSLGPASGGEQEKADATIRAMAAIRSLGSDVTSLVVSHMNQTHAEQTNGTTRPFGSIYVGAMARKLWEVRKSSHTGAGYLDVGLFNTKVNDGQPDGPFGARITWDQEAFTVKIRRTDLRDDAELVGRMGPTDRIIAALRSGDVIEMAELIKMTGAEPNTVRSILSRLKEEGQVRRIEPPAGTDQRKIRWRIAGDE